MAQRLTLTLTPRSVLRVGDMDMETDNHTAQRPWEQGLAGEASWRR